MARHSPLPSPDSGHDVDSIFRTVTICGSANTAPDNQKTGPVGGDGSFPQATGASPRHRKREAAEGIIAVRMEIPDSESGLRHTLSLPALSPRRPGPRHPIRHGCRPRSAHRNTAGPARYPGTRQLHHRESSALFTDDLSRFSVEPPRSRQALAERRAHPLSARDGGSTRQAGLAHPLREQMRRADQSILQGR
jgi:hypothetical protein